MKIEVFNAVHAYIYICWRQASDRSGDEIDRPRQDRILEFYSNSDSSSRTKMVAWAGKKK